MRIPFQLLSLVAAVLLPSTQASSSIRNPIGAISSVQNATIHTKNGRVTALSHFDLTFNIRDDLHVKLSLEPNHNILAEGATVSYLAPDGTITREESVDRLSHKVFKGETWVQRPRVGEDRWQRVGWGRVFVRKDGETPLFEGAFAVDHDHHHIQSSVNYMRTRHQYDPEIDMLDGDQQYMVVWRDSDILPDIPLEHQGLRRAIEVDAPSCQSNNLEFNLNPAHPVYLGMSHKDPRAWGIMEYTRLSKRQIDTTTGGNGGGVNLVSTIGSSSGCPTTNKVALVGVATDCTYTSAFDTKKDVQDNVITQMNTASGIWEGAFKISLGLANLTMSDASCPGAPAQTTLWNQGCSQSVDIGQRLNYFSAWRGTQKDNNSHWTLLSTCNTGAAVGLAWLGQACINTAMTSNNSYTGNGAANDGTETVSGANVVIRSSGTNEWAIIAHETGHTYGAVHDCDSTTCADANYVNAQQCCPLSSSTCNADAQYIMNPYTGQGITHFSPCTIGNICSAIGRNSVNTECLSDNKDVQTFSGPQCGNGIVEPGEECDCGGTAGCGDDPCCDGSTCKFKNGAVCDDANEECCNNCQFMAQGSVCRPSTSSCDPQEVCPGNGGNCPPDKTAPNGQSCGSGLECASGQCTSRDQQCKSVMGSYTKGNDTYACDSQGCVISCASPEFGSGVCYGLQQNFLDGTECGGGGHCQNVRSFLPSSPSYIC